MLTSTVKITVKVSVKLLQRALLVVLVSSGLMGCISNTAAPTTYHYILDTKPTGAQSIISGAAATNEQSFIKLLPINVPDYLNQPNLVLKLSNHQIKIANYHFWAEDLRQSIQRVLLKELNHTKRDTNTDANISVVYAQNCISCDELMITIDHFYPTEQGEVVLSGTYEMIAKGGKQTQTQFALVSTLEEGGYDEAVSTMRAMLGELAKSI